MSYTHWAQSRRFPVPAAACNLDLPPALSAWRGFRRRPLRAIGLGTQSARVYRASRVVAAILDTDLRCSGPDRGSCSRRCWDCTNGHRHNTSRSSDHDPCRRKGPCCQPRKRFRAATSSHCKSSRARRHRRNTVPAPRPTASVTAGHVVVRVGQIIEPVGRGRHRPAAGRAIGRNRAVGLNRRIDVARRPDVLLDRPQSHRRRAKPAGDRQFPATAARHNKGPSWPPCRPPRCCSCG